MIEINNVRCWSCGVDVDLQQRADADGHCPYCDAEIDIEEYEIEAIEQESDK